jgi:uncharacterized protein
VAENRKETPALTRAHSAALAARMLTLEQDCREIERTLDGYEGIFVQYLGVFPDETRQAIRNLLSEILQKITRIRLDLGLPQRQIEIDKMLAAHLSQIWVTLHETNAYSLRGYGTVPDELSAYLDPRIDQLLDLVASLRGTVEAGKKPISSEGEAEKDGSGIALEGDDMEHERFEGERTLMRIHIGESDRWQGSPLYDALIKLFRREGFSGVTVLRGVAGYGSASRIHTDKILRLSQDLPVVIEVVEYAERIESVLPKLDEMVGGGLVTLEKVRVILYRSKKKGTPVSPSAPQA